MNAHARIELPERLLPVFSPPRGSVSYRTARGGRGSGKSFNFAKMAAIWGVIESVQFDAKRGKYVATPFRVLCIREYQNSIKESFHAELKAAIASEPWLAAFYDVGVDYIRSRNRLVEFIFRGIHGKEATIKSLAKIDLTIIEEAEDVSEGGWLALEATVLRQDKSEIWAIWNPRSPESPVNKRFVISPPERSINIVLNWPDNPFFPAGLEELRAREQERLDPNTYAHIWEGEFLTNSETQVLGGRWRIEEFTIDDEWDGPYQGGDFGFSQDPTAAVRCWIHDETLYISHEAGAKKLETTDIADFLIRRIPAFALYVTRWDSARPETISHLKKSGLALSEPVDKWKGSVEDGVAFMRAFKEIVIHPRCVETIREARLYSYKVDRLTKDILPDIVDAWNHYIDAIRYALAPLIKRGSEGGFFLSRRHR